MIYTLFQLNKMRIEIHNTDGSAFQDDKAGELARILRDIAEKIEDGFDGGICRDYNGNKVGEWST